MITTHWTSQYTYDNSAFYAEPFLKEYDDWTSYYVGWYSGSMMIESSSGDPMEQAPKNWTLEW